MTTFASVTRRFPAALIVVALVVIFSLASPYFLTGGNIEAMLGANAVVLIAAVGMTFVFLAGGIDLSIATVISFSAVVSGMIMNVTDNVGLGVIAALAAGALVGIVNGLLVGIFALSPFITTMATGLVARGLAFVLSQGIAVKGTPFWLLDFGFVTFAGIPAVTIVALLVVILAGFALHATSWGRAVMLVGSNPSAARFAGLSVKGVNFSVYFVSALLAGLAGFVSIANLGNAIPGVGDTLLLLIIGAVVLGGTTMDGGSGSTSRTLIGVALLAVLVNGLNLMGIPFYDQLIVQGILIFFGTWLSSRLAKGRRI